MVSTEGWPPLLPLVTGQSQLSSVDFGGPAILRFDFFAGPPQQISFSLSSWLQVSAPALVNPSADPTLS